MAVAGTRLAWSVWIVWHETRSRRRRHRHLVDLPGDTDGLVPALRVLREQTPIAYCVPGRSEARVVVSRGTIAALSAWEYAAVLGHERAHVRHRHDLVLEGFSVLHRASPRFLRTDAPLHQSRIMIELLADDAARKVSDEASVAAALAALAGAPTPFGVLGMSGSETIRMARLGNPRPDAPLACVAAYAISAIVLIAPTVLLAVPSIVHAWRMILA